MLNLFKKIRAVKVVRRYGKTLYIPKADVPHVLRLADQESLAKASGAANFARWELWSYIEELFPETINGHWSLDVATPTHPCLRQILESSDD